jgi:hypothetical protein
MTMLRRRIPILVAALTLAFLVSGARALPRRASTECERNTSWNIWNQLDDRQTSDTVNGKTSETQDISSRSEQHSSRGEYTNDNQSHHTNADGSGHEHEDFHYTDSTGQGCGNDGIPQKGDSSTDTDWDSKGNRKLHHEEIIEKNGKCEKYVRDQEWDSKGKLIKDVESKTEVPCSKWYLQVFNEGTMSVGDLTAHYGPDNVIIYLGSTAAKSYAGQFDGFFHEETTGKCSGFGIFPTKINVAAEEVEFGAEDEMDFTVEILQSGMASLTCPGGSGSRTGSIPTKTYTFSLPPEDGASRTFTESLGGYGQEIYTFTLKKR